MTAPVTIVTGAAGALGSEVTRLLIERGHRVAAADVVADKLRDLTSAHPDQSVALAFNAASLAEWPRALELTGEQLGVPTGAVLAAGTWAGGKPVHEQRADETVWRQMLEINLETARTSLQALLPLMVEQKRGSIVVIGSIAVERPWESAGAAAYAAAKSALVAYARSVAKEVLDTGVRVNAVMPSLIDTPANRRAMPDADFSRWVSTASLAGVIAFLLSDEARDVSGAALPVYGRA